MPRDSPVQRQAQPDNGPRVETMEWLGMVSRILRAAGRRVADADEPELVRLVALREELEDAISVGIHGQRRRHSWGRIANALGVRRQSAYERWGRR